MSVKLIAFLRLCFFKGFKYLKKITILHILLSLVMQIL